MPKLSVILPVYNGAKYIKEAVESILNQTYQDFDLFVIDDGSSDNTIDILQAFNHNKLKIILNEGNKGLIFTLNKGLSLSADYEYIARMDADDISLPNRLAATANILDNNAKIGVVGTSVKYWGLGLKDKKLILPEKNDSILPAFICKNPIVHPTVMIRNSILQESGIVYDPDYYKYEDYKLWVDLFNKCEFYNTPDVHFLYRRHSENISNVGNYKLAEDLQMINGILSEYAKNMGFTFTESELYTLSIITGTYRWQSDLNLDYREVYVNINNIIDKHNENLVNKTYLSNLLWERVFVYFIKVKKYAGLMKLVYKLKFSVHYKSILRIHNNWF